MKGKVARVVDAVVSLLRDRHYRESGNDGNSFLFSNIITISYAGYLPCHMN